MVELTSNESVVFKRVKENTALTFIKYTYFYFYNLLCCYH